MSIYNPLRDQVHPEYSEMQSAWRRCRDAYLGQDAIKSAGESYLPKLNGQTDEEYKAYKMRALFYSITGKTVQALTGLATTKAPIVTYPEKCKAWFEDGSDIEFFELRNMAIQEDLLMGRIGILIDRSLDGSRVYPTLYKTEDIRDWEIDDDGKLIYLLIREKIYRRQENRLHSEKWLYRQLSIDADGYYLHEVSEVVGDFSQPPTDWQGIQVVNYGRRMTYIPFILINSIGVNSKVIKPPMLDIVDINLSHYMTSADLEHGRHFTGLPTPVVTGSNSDTALKVGSASAWILPDPHATAFYLEFKGEGLKSLETALSEKERQLASLSAKLIDSSTRGSEAAEVVRLRHSSESASLATVVNAVEAGLTQAYAIMLDMSEIAGSITIKFDKSFLNTKMSAQELTALTSALGSGAITPETFVYNLRRGDMLPDSVTDEEEVELIKAQMSKADKQPLNQPPLNQ